MACYVLLTLSRKRTLIEIPIFFFLRKIGTEEPTTFAIFHHLNYRPSSNKHKCHVCYHHLQYQRNHHEHFQSQLESKLHIITIFSLPKPMDISINISRFSTTCKIFMKSIKSAFPWNYTEFIRPFEESSAFASTSLKYSRHPGNNLVLLLATRSSSASTFLWSIFSDLN